jgi:hypothetical protein
MEEESEKDGVDRGVRPIGKMRAGGEGGRAGRGGKVCVLHCVSDVCVTVCECCSVCCSVCVPLYVLPALDQG